MISRLLVLVLLGITNVSAAPLGILTTSGPGSMSDTAVRYIQPLLERELNRRVFVENRPGALGLIGFNEYMQRPADGNTLLVGGTQIAYIAKTRPNLRFDLMGDLEPLYGLSQAPQQILVPANSPVRSYKDLEVLYRNKGTLHGGSSHPSTQLSMKLLDEVNRATTTVVNYKQPGQLASELVSGIIDYTISAVGNAATDGFVQSGQLRSVGILRDLGVEEFSWTGFFINKNTPERVKNQMRLAIERVMKSPEMQGFHQQTLLENSIFLRKQLEKEYNLIPLVP